MPELAVLTRAPDGTVACQARSPVPTRTWFSDARLYAKDPEFLAAYVGLGRLGDRDPSVPLAPVEGGMVVVDLQRDAFLSMQGAIDYAVLDPRAYGRFAPPAVRARLMGLVESGRLRRGGGDVLTPDTVAGAVERAARGEDGAGIAIDMAPLRYASFAPDAEGAQALRSALAELGFEPAPADAWTAWAASREAADKPKRKASRRA